NCARTFPPMKTVVAQIQERALLEAPLRRFPNRRSLLGRRLCYVLGIWRAFAVVFFSLCALVQNAISIPFVRRDRRLDARGAWLHGWCRFACRVLGIRIRTHGSMPSSGLLVSNHLSYLDIVVLSSIRPCVFVAKREIGANYSFSPAKVRAGNRKEIARELRDELVSIRS